MDSLLANYASSDEEEEEEQQQQPQKPIPSTPSKTTSSSSSSLFSALPQPKSSSSSLFQSLPPPKQPPSHTLTDTPSSAFSNLTQTPSSIPKPKSQIHEQPKRIVQFKPPIIPLPKPTKHDDSEDEDDEEEERSRRRKLDSSVQTPSVKSFLSSIPAPRNSATLGVQASSASGRRSIIETDSPPPPAASSSGGSASESNVPVDQNGGDYENYQYPIEQYDSYGNYSWGATAEAGAGAETSAGMATYSYGNADDGYASYGAYGNYGQYANNWDEGSMATVQEEVPVSSSESIMKFHGKRGRKDVPVEVIEVKQDELMKNRPREDQVKLTGLAFGPTYQVLSRFVLFCFVLSCLDFDSLMNICPRRK